MRAVFNENSGDGSKHYKITLFDNVQFLYELKLAFLELASLGAKFKFNSLSFEFTLLEAENLEKLLKRLAYFQSINDLKTDYFHIVKANRTRSFNQYLTHWFYPYKGKFHPQMIRALLNIIGINPGDIVLDPFIGSGTLALEAQLLGINCIGLDISPLCVLQSKVKTQSIAVSDKITQYNSVILKQINSNPKFPKDVIDDFVSSLSDENLKNFYILAKLVAISDMARRRRNFLSSFIKNLNLMTLSVLDYVEIIKRLELTPGCVSVSLGDARFLPFGDSFFDGIITSPPYSVALDYVANDIHALEALNCDIAQVKENLIGLRGKGRSRIELYNEDLEMVIKQMYRVLKPGRFAVIIIGNAKYLGEEAKTTEFVIEKALESGFELVENIDKAIFGLYNVMQRENILIFKKPL